MKKAKINCDIEFIVPDDFDFNQLYQLKFGATTDFHSSEVYLENYNFTGKDYHTSSEVIPRSTVLYSLKEVK